MSAKNLRRKAALAAPAGFWLHRSLVELGFHNLVVVPARLDAYGRKVNDGCTLAPASFPTGRGASTFAQTEAEVCDWNRFQHCKQPASFAGLCGVSGSAAQHSDLPLIQPTGVVQSLRVGRVGHLGFRLAHSHRFSVGLNGSFH